MTDFTALDYLKAHSSILHQQVVIDLREKGVQFEEYIELGEQYVDFFISDFNLFVFLLEAEHDHTDSYHLEKELKEAALSAGARILFIEQEHELTHWLEQQIS